MQLNNETLTLYGAGGHCKVVIDILHALGINVTKVVDDNPGSDRISGIPLLLPDGHYDSALITIGNCEIRKKIVSSIKVKRYLTAIHPSAIVSPSAKLREGTVVMQGAVVQSSTNIGRHCIINTNSSIDHDCEISDFVHIAPGVSICGGVNIGEGSWIGAGSVVIQGVRIGKNCMIGAGAVVVSDIPDNSLAYGNPCKVVRQNH